MISRVYGKEDADVVLVTAYPFEEDITAGKVFSGPEKLHYEFLFERAGLDFDNVQVVCCTDNIYRVGASKLAENFNALVQPVIDSHERKAVILLGADAAGASGLEFTKLGEVRNRIIDKEKYKLIVGTNPYFLRTSPDDIEDTDRDLSLLRRVLKNDLDPEHPICIKRLDSPQAVRDFINSCKTSGRNRVAYDTETTDKDKSRAKLVSMAFCNGEVTDEGIDVVYYWAGYDRLVPLYSPEELKQFDIAFIELFLDEYIEFIAHNASYDDWIIENNLNITFKQSSYDTMEMKWVCDKDGNHGLKESVARYLGYPDYEAAIKDDLQAVKGRRNRRLIDEDINLLKDLGYEPEYSVTGLPKWNTAVDKGYAMYALLPKDKLERYNSFDALFTFKLFQHFNTIIESDPRLVRSLALRRRIGKEFMRCEQYGMELDVDLNRAYSKQCEAILDSCNEAIDKVLIGQGYEDVEFNINSNTQLTTYLYGTPIKLPFVEPILNNKKIWKKQDTEKFHRDIYGNFERFRALDDPSKLNLDKIEEFVRLQATKIDPRFNLDNITIVYKDVYCRGRYTPVAFSKKTGKPSCGVAVLKLLAEKDDNEFITLLLMQRKAKKIKSTFLDGILKLRDSRNVIHPRMNQVGTESGRGSSSNPNSQNLIKYLRGLFKSRKGYILDYDLSQAEIRALAAESGDQHLIEAAKGDLHTFIAKRIFPGQEITSEKRRQSKTVVFGIIYGIGVDKLATTLTITIEEAENLIKYFEIAFPEAYKWMLKQVAELKSGKHGYYVWTAFGTRRLVRSILSTDPYIRSHAERIAMNSPIQGDAGEYTFWLICEMNDWLRANGLFDKARMFNTTHDSVSVDCTPDMLDIELDDSGVPVSENGCDYTIKGGVLYEYCKNLVEQPAPVEPLNRVQFKADFEVRNRWSAKPDLLLALDPKEDLYNWDLIKGKPVVEEDEGEIEFAQVI
jgi:DNA polymerase I-like protein with 3'-5' exonuclease and polymerase domains